MKVNPGDQRVVGAEGGTRSLRVPEPARGCLLNSRGPIQSLDQCQGTPGSAPGLLQRSLQKGGLAGALCPASSMPRDTLLNSMNGKPKTDGATVFEDAIELVAACSSMARRAAHEIKCDSRERCVVPGCPRFPAARRQTWRQIRGPTHEGAFNEVGAGDVRLLLLKAHERRIRRHWMVEPAD